MGKILAKFKNDNVLQCASVIFPSCDAREYRWLRTFQSGMVIVNNVVVLIDGAFRAFNVMQAFCPKGWQSENFFESMRRFARFCEYPRFYMLDPQADTAYRVDTVTGERKPQGRIVYHENISDAGPHEFSVIYDEHAREVGNIMLIILGAVLESTPGLAECRDDRVPMEKVLAVKAAGKAKDPDYIKQIKLK